MLNGKFYTGLPPKMMERSNGTPNRLESHLFWPDDTQKETAQETRTRRRSSLQTDTPRNPATTYQRQSSWTNNAGGIGGENEVDTKQRFQKEFAKSSIQFCDNIQEEDYGNRTSKLSQMRRNAKKDITTKPTAIKMPLPNNHDSAHDEYAANQKKQAFSSKIQFYDYVDDGAARRNNQIKAKMDMNDKKEVERHTKNSPKLQAKGIERNLRLVDEQRNNERERFTPDRYVEDYDETERSKAGARIIRNEVRGGERRSNVGQQQHGKRYESPKRGNSTNYQQHDLEDTDYAYNERRYMSRAQSVPKKILKHPNNFERDYNDDYNDYDNGSKRDLEHLEHSTRNMRIRDAPKKHVSYGDEAYEYEAQHDDYDDERKSMHNSYREYGQDSKSSSRTSARNGAITSHNSSRSEAKTINRQMTGKNERRRNSPTENHLQNGNQRIDEQVERSTHKSVTQTNNRNLNNSNERSKLNNQRLQNQNQHQRSTPKMSLAVGSAAAAPAPAANDSATSPTSPTLDSQKHLRSSLCFSGGEIVANNNNNNRGETPTSESGSRNRTARSIATTRRVCVGLPD